jgi:hypothetical protein
MKMDPTATIVIPANATHCWNRQAADRPQRPRARISVERPRTFARSRGYLISDTPKILKKCNFVPIPVLEIDEKSFLVYFKESSCPHLATYQAVKQSLSFGTKPGHANADF